MSREQLFSLYERCKEEWKKSGKDILIDEDKIEKFCNYSEALTNILAENNLLIDTNHGGPVFNSEQGKLIINLVKEDDLNDIVGSISLGYNGIGISYVNRGDFQEAYNNLSYNGDYLTGNVGRIDNNSNLVTTIIEKDSYSIAGNNYQYATTDEAEKITEIYNALALETEKNGKRI